MQNPDDDVAALRAEVEQLRREMATTSRRGMLRLAGAAVIGAGAAAVLGDAAPAAADNGIVNGNPGATTTLTHTAPTGFHFKSSDSTYSTNSEVVQVSAGTASRHCIRAFANNITSAIFVRNEGIGSALLATSHSIGATATFLNDVGPTLNLAVTPGKVDPRLRTGETQFIGGLDVDGQGTLWYCTATGFSGPPGSWKRIVGPQTAGAFQAINPVRVYDSRKAAYTPNGVRAANTSFLVPVRDARDTNTGAVTVPNVVPAGATAIAYNVVAAATTGSNFLSVTPGDAASAAASTLNWVGAGQTIANGSIVKIDVDRQVKVFMGTNVGSAHVLIDVQGYWL